MNIFRRLPLFRLLLLCGVVVLVGATAAIALALGSGPTPPAKSLPVAVHDALAGGAATKFEGVSANVELTNHLLEGANLATGGANGTGTGGAQGVTSNPLVAGGSGRLWIAADGRMRLELQAEQGDTEVFYDGHTLKVYDAADTTLYTYTPPAGHTGSHNEAGDTGHAVPSLASIEEAIAHLERNATVSGATPTDVAGRAAYTVRVSPKQSGSLLGGAELSFDAETGAPLRAAVYSSTDPSPVIELAASSLSYGPVADSVFAFTPPPGTKVEQIELPHDHAGKHTSDSANKPSLSVHGSGPTAIAELQATGKDAANSSSTAGLPQVSINGAQASELRTELGTLLTFERGGVRYVLAGSVTPSTLEAFARGL